MAMPARRYQRGAERRPSRTDRRAIPGAEARELGSAAMLGDFNAFTADRVLTEALQRESGGWARQRLIALGAFAGSAHARELAAAANANTPRLRTHDRYGQRINEVEYHPAWHELLGAAVEHGLHSSPWAEPRPGAHVARGAAFLCMSETEAGIGCPSSATHSAVAAPPQQPAPPGRGGPG